MQLIFKQDIMCFTLSCNMRKNELNVKNITKIKIMRFFGFSKAKSIQKKLSIFEYLGIINCIYFNLHDNSSFSNGMSQFLENFYYFSSFLLIKNSETFFP